MSRVRNKIPLSPGRRLARQCRRVGLAALFSACACSLLAASDGAGVEEGSFDSNGVEIHYTVEGEGEPVLLIHGYRADGNLNWRFPGVNNALSSAYRVITIDNRGHGGSGKPADPEAYGREMVEDQVRLLDHLGIESAHVAGYSMGGMITLRLLADHPERVRSAAICGMGWRQSEPRPDGELPPRDERTKVEHWAAAASWPALDISRAELESIKVPMIAIIGADDGLLERTVVPMREVRPDIPLVLIEDASHAAAPMKASFREAVRSWVDQQASSKSEE